jgi:phage gp29-like protein
MPSFLEGLWQRVERIARTVRGPEVSRVAQVKGVPEPRDPQRVPVLDTQSVYTSRVSPLAGPTRDRWALWNADDLTPEKIVAAQRTAITGGIPLNWIEMIDQVYSRDGHYSSVTSQRVADVIKGDYRLTRAANDDAGTAARNFVEECYRGTARFRDGLGWLLYSNLYGYNAIEIEWGEDWVTIGPVLCAIPRRFYNVHPKHFRFSLEVATEDDPLFWIGDGYQPLPVGKFVFLDGDGLHPLKVRHGHAWQCIWYSMFRSISWAGWATRVNRFDMPIPILSYNGDLDQYPEYQQAMLDIDKALGSGKGIRYPNNNMTLDIKDPPSGGRASDPQSALASACDVGQTIRVLGAEMTNATGNTGSFAAKSQDMMVKFALEEFDSARLWERMDEQLSAPLIRFNAVAIADALRAAGYSITPQQLMRRVPKGKQRVPRETDPRTEAEIAGLYINEIGLDVSMEGLFDRIDLPRAKSDADRAPGKAQPVAKGAALVSAGEAADEAHVNPDPTDTAPADPEPSGDAEGKATAPPPGVDLAPTDLAAIVTVNQALVSQGLPPMPAPDGDLTVAEFKAKHAATIATASAAAKGDEQ